MYSLLIYIQFFLIFFLFIVSPILVITSGKKSTTFCMIWIELYIAQLFMYYPGADVSPYAYTKNMIKAIRIAGFSLSAIVSILLLFWILENSVYRLRYISKKILSMFICAFIVNLYALLLSPDISHSIDYFVKIMAPFIVMTYLSAMINEEWFNALSKSISVINIILCLQVVVCKIFEGHFAAYNYYWEYAEEYFGYYNHPHSFTGLLAFLAIWNVYQINRKRRVYLNLFLFCINIVLMYLSGVRTYLAALALGLAYIGICALNSSKLKDIRKYVYFAIGTCIIFGSKLISNFGLNRAVETDVSSGRFARWNMDIRYIIDNYSICELLFGRGANAIFSVNKEIFNKDINSLNLLIDFFADYGLLGMTLLLISYLMIFRCTYSKTNGIFQRGIFIIFVTASMINNITSYVTITIMMVVILILLNFEGRSIKEGQTKNVKCME